MTDTPKLPRAYRKITPAVIAKYKATEIIEGNGAAAVRATEKLTGSKQDARRRAWLIRTKAKAMDSGEYIDHKMQQIGVEAIERVESMVQSPDERIATKNAHFIIDHVRGKALQRSETKHLNLNIEAVLE